jgi:hypothetical protein
MYQRLLNADVVIADVSTYNPNFMSWACDMR